MVGVGASEFIIVIFLMGGGFGLPLGVPPEKEDPLLAYIAPEECLFYTSWSGMAAADPKSANATERMFADPELQKFVAGIEKLIDAGLLQIERREGPEAAGAARDAWKWGRLAMTRPGAIYMESFELQPRAPKPKGALVINVGENAGALRDALEKYEGILFRGPALKIEDVTIGTGSFRRTKVHPEAPPVTWGVVRNYFMIGLGEGSIEGIMERARAKSTPKWLADIQAKLPVERRSTIAYVNVEGIKKVAGPAIGIQGERILAELGVDNVKSVIAVTGLDDKGFLSRMLIELDGPAKGLLTLLSAKPLTAADLNSIPADSTIAAAVRFDANKTVQLVMDIVGAIEPRGRQEFLRGLEMADEELGVKIREDLLASLGDVWRVYSSPSDGGWVLPGLTLVVDAKEPERLEAALRKLVRMIPEREGVLRTSRFGNADLHVLQGTERFSPLAVFSPTWAITEDKLIVSFSPNPVKGYLSRGQDFKSLADNKDIAEALSPEKGASMIGYHDTKEIVRLVYPFAPFFAQAISVEARRGGFDFDISTIPSAQAVTRHLQPGVSTVTTTKSGIEFTARQTLPTFNLGTAVPIGAGLLIPAVAAARDAADRNMSINNIKQMVLAAFNYESQHKSFPPAFTAKDGKPLLSWRVHILPYLEEQALYDQFHLDEPWDSEHNKTLIEKMPKVFRSPGVVMEKGKTGYLGIRRPDSIFTGEKGTRIQDITDGTSNTIMIVEASPAAAVIWSKPDDLTFDEKNPTQGLLFRRGEVCIAGFADGHVESVFRFRNPGFWKAAFTRNGGEDRNGDAREERFPERRFNPADPDSPADPDATPAPRPRPRFEEAPPRFERPLEKKAAP